MKHLAKRKISEQFKLGEKFLAQIKPEEKVVLLHHTDVDGISSGVVTYTGLKRIGVKVGKIMHADPENILKHPAEIKKFKIIISSDVPFDNRDFIEKEKKYLIIDHHTGEDLNGKDVVLINPRLEKENLYQSTSYVSYKFFSRMTNMRDVEWIAVIGAIADYSFKDCSDVISKYVKTKDVKRIWKTKFGKAAYMLNSAIHKFGIDETFKILISLKNVEELLKNKKIEEAHTEFLKQLKVAEKDFWKNAENYREMIFSVIKTEGRIGSTLSSQLSTKYPRKLIILARKRDGTYGINARWQNSRIGVDYLMKKACDIEGGGHPAAGGGSVRNIKRFKEKLLKELNY